MNILANNILYIKLLYRKYNWCFVLIALMLTVKILSLFPNFITVVYSETLYLKISAFRWRLFGNIPFSVGDMLYFIAGLYIIYTLRKQKSFDAIINHLVKYTAIFYILFNLLWGFNYYRTPLHQTKQIDYQYHYEDLLHFTRHTIDKANQIHSEIVFYEHLKVEYPFEMEEIFQKAEVFEQPLQVKTSLISLILSYMGFGGYINPFTCESQVNKYLPKYVLPTVTLHEMAHQIGYASESEANYIAYHKASTHSDIYFRYAAELFALKYCLKQIKEINPDDYSKLSDSIYKGIWLSFEESIKFKEKYHTPIDTFFDYLYHYFLKANAQEDGIGEYSKFIGLLINEYKQNYKDLTPQTSSIK
ncbi:MAG: DUF3810 domain-containing protein [Bacteroidota bacterium]|nr:DUF3810 domain-containing protein [Bacteroidota bacterium]